MQWIKFSDYNVPPQGLKILCFRHGDVWIARRLRYKGQDFFLEIPYGGKKGAICTDRPDYWCEMDLPEGCKGHIKISLNGRKLMTLDELERHDPEYHEEFVEMLVLKAHCALAKEKN